MYALYSKPEVLMNVTWPHDLMAEDVTRALAHEDDLPLEWGVDVDRVCGSISIAVVNAKGCTVRVRRGKSVDFYADGRDGYYDAPDGHDAVTVHGERQVGVVYDAECLDDLRDLADRGHNVVVRLDYVIVDRVRYDGYILRDEDGTLSELPYDDPQVYATAMGLDVKAVPLAE